MAQIRNTMEIFKLLDKSNCRKCNESTCLAFAAAVFKGQRQIEECPQLDQEIIGPYSGAVERPKLLEQDTEEAISRLRDKLSEVDLAEAARRLGGDFKMFEKIAQRHG